MAKIAKVDEAGHVVRRFHVHGFKVRLCYWGGHHEDDQQQWAVRPGMLPDFPDSEVSAPLGQAEDQGEGEERAPESVRPTTRSVVEDEAMRTKFRSNSPTGRAPAWLEVEDAVLEEPMSEEETDWKVREWLSRTTQQQDAESIRGNHTEPMTRANHGASYQPACNRL